MNIKDLLKEDSIILDTTATNKEEAIQEMVAKHYQCGHIQNQDIYYQAILEREKALQDDNLRALEDNVSSNVDILKRLSLLEKAVFKNK